MSLRRVVARSRPGAVDVLGDDWIGSKGEGGDEAEGKLNANVE